MMTATMKMPKVQKIAKPERIVNDAPRTFTDASWPVGSVAHQGDVILVRIEKMPGKPKERLNRQVADGNTQGSRHILHAGKIYDGDTEDLAKAIKKVCPKSNVQAKYVGPVFETDAATALRHPEHGDHEYEAGMCVVVVFQRNLDAEQRESRVED